MPENSILKTTIISCLLLASSFYFATACQQKGLPSFIKTSLDKITVEHPEASSHSVVIISIPDQCLYLVKQQQIIQNWPISSSAFGVGCRAGSNKTPYGMHRVKYKFGTNKPVGIIFKARKSTGKTARIYKDKTNVKEDLVTTRIIWLEGLEMGLNRGDGIDSYKRYIYIHGTNEEGLIGTPASHGCIRMRNNDVIQLYKQISIGTLVDILEQH